MFYSRLVYFDVNLKYCYNRWEYRVWIQVQVQQMDMGQDIGFFARAKQGVTTLGYFAVGSGILFMIGKWKKWW